MLSKYCADVNTLDSYKSIKKELRTMQNIALQNVCVTPHSSQNVEIFWRSVEDFPNSINKEQLICCFLCCINNNDNNNKIFISVIFSLMYIPYYVLSNHLFWQLKS